MRPWCPGTWYRKRECKCNAMKQIRMLNAVRADRRSWVREYFIDRLKRSQDGWSRIVGTVVRNRVDVVGRTRACISSAFPALDPICYYGAEKYCPCHTCDRSRDEICFFGGGIEQSHRRGDDVFDEAGDLSFVDRMMLSWRHQVVRGAQLDLSVARAFSSS